MRQRHLLRRTVVVLGALTILALPGCGLLGDTPGDFELSARFARGTGLYPGSPVRILGIDVGRVTEVENVDGHVLVRMALDDDVRIVPDAAATIVPLTLLGERYVQLGPAWTDGETLPSGSTIPLERTTVPAEIDELLRSVQDFMGAIDPQRAGDVVTGLAAVLEGQGASLNDLLADASETLDLLADKDDELAAIIESLSELTATLEGHTDNIETFVRNYDLVAQLLVDNKDDVDAVVTQLNRATGTLAEVLVAHRDPMAQDMEVLATTASDVDANAANVRTTLAATVKLFEAADRAYDRRMQALAANNQLAPDLTADLIAGRLRDRIAGLCRRLGIPLCSDPAAPLLNELAGLLPNLLSQLAGGTPIGSSPVTPGLSVDETPADPVPVPTTPTMTPAGPTPEELLDSLAGTLVDGLDSTSAALLGTLDTERLTALLGLDPALLQVLPILDEDQVSLLRAADPALLGDVLADLANVVNPPAQRLDTPLLPGTSTTTASVGAPGASTGNPVLDVLGALLGAGS